MSKPPEGQCSSLAPNLTAPQQKPRPLPLFLSMLRSETAREPERLRRALLGLRLYQEAERSPPLPMMPAIAAIQGACLRDYGGDGPDLLFIPSLINPPNVLDIAADRSLLRWMAGHGFRVLLLDWGSDVHRRAEMSVAGHVEEIVLPLLRTLPTPPSLIGYCLGGTMAVAAAAHARPPALVTIAAPWRFSGFADEVRTMLGGLWTSAQPSVAALGVLPMEILQSVFWSLDPSRTVAKFEDFADFAPGGPEQAAFVRLEDWANDGPPLPAAAARELFEKMIGADETGTGRWRVGGALIDPASLACPQLHIVSTSDRIVPEASSILAGERRLLDQGHVGMVVGGRARASLWEPLADWLSQCGRPTPVG